jgi:hypothetical protein
MKSSLLIAGRNACVKEISRRLARFLRGLVLGLMVNRRLADLGLRALSTQARLPGPVIVAFADDSEQNQRDREGGSRDMAQYLLSMSVSGPLTGSDVQGTIASVRTVAAGLGGNVERGWLGEDRSGLFAVVDLPDELPEQEVGYAFVDVGAVGAVKSTPVVGLFMCAHGRPSQTGMCEHRPM